MRSPKHVIDEKRMTVIAAADLMERAIRARVDGLHHQFAYQVGKMQALSPLSVIARGYSAVFNENGALVKSVRDVNADATVNIRVSDGEIVATVQKTIKKKNKRTVSNERKETEL